MDLGPLSGRRYRSVCVVAMGGSALPAELAQACFAMPPLRIWRNYGLPPRLSDEDLVICASFSGNTEETLDAFAEARRQRLPLIAISHDGLLGEAARESGVPWLKLPECIQPRYALGYFFSGILNLLHRLALLPSYQAELKRLAEQMRLRDAEWEKLGREIAPRLLGRVPLIYAAPELEAVAHIDKIKFNENAKIPCFYNVFPELNHNELAGFTQSLFPATILYLKSPWMHPRVEQRMRAMADFLKPEIPALEVNPPSETWLEHNFALLLIVDYASYYLALSYRQDPTPVPMIEDFKERLKRWAGEAISIHALEELALKSLRVVIKSRIGEAWPSLIRTTFGGMKSNPSADSRFTFPPS